MDDLLNQITGLTDRERKKALIWVASLPEEKILGIFQFGVKKSFQIREERPDLPGRIIKYCAFIVACRMADWDTLKGKGYRVAEKEQYGDFSHLRKAKAAELIGRGRTPVLRRKILAYCGEVKELKAEGMGFRPIADYLARQKDKRNYLQISLAKKGETVKEECLDGQEVIMLDIALGKAINLLTPTSSDKAGDIFGW